MIRKFFLFFLALFFFFGLIGAGIATWGYFYVTRDLPELSSVKDYRPASVTKVYAGDGTLVAEFFRERRYPAKLSEIPMVIREAFLAAEDASFYKHPGIDPISILRASIRNLQAGSAKQGASTITQQVVKNLLLTPERKIERKIKEAILSYRLEQGLTKDEIFEVYLNQIFLGNTAYGVKAAAKAYFKKELNDVTLAEAAMLAGLPKAPSRFSPISNYPRARERQRYVLRQMVEAKFISEDQAKAAEDEKLKVYQATAQNIYAAPYFITELRKIFSEKFKDADLEGDGYEIFTTLDLTATKLAEKGLQIGLRDVDKRRGWRGPIGKIDNGDKRQFLQLYGPSLPAQVEEGDVYPALVTEISKAKGTAVVDVGTTIGTVDVRAAGWAKKRLTKEENAVFIKPEEAINVGDVIEVSLLPKDSSDLSKTNSVGNFKLDQTPLIEGAVVILDPNSGRVISMVGGYSYQKSVFNRVTQSLRQPGSTFKPIVYLAAVDGFKYTPSTIVYDTPRSLKVGDEIWSPGNYDEKYLGPITLRTALERSRNMVSVDIVSRIGISPVLKYARLLGITSPLGKNPSIALGSSEVTLLELSRAYGVFAAKGVLFDSFLINKVLDRNGAVYYDHESESIASARQVISPQSAFIMANVMKGVVQSGTATVIKPINRPVAGKTGTTNDMMDAWFIGFTPEWVCGIWTGFDVKKTIGDKETGGRVAAPIWLKTMQPYLDYQDQVSYEKLELETKQAAEKLNIEYRAPEKITPVDFQPPEDVIGVWVNKSSGRLASPGEEGSIYEYFLKGTEPQAIETMPEETASYLESPDL